MPVRVWQAADLLPRSRSSCIECGKRKPPLDIIAAQQQPLTRWLAGESSLSVAVNATYSEVTARTRVCLHIDITAGRKTLGRQREGGRENRDLIPSKLSADLLAVIW